MEAKTSSPAKGAALEPFLREIHYQQLFLADLQRPRSKGPPVGPGGRRKSRRPPTQPQPTAPLGWIQLKLPIEVRRDFSHFDRRWHADLANPWLARARNMAQTVGEARGWTPRVASYVDRSLVILLSSHANGDKIRYSEAFQAIRSRGMSVERTVEILDHLDLLDDDRIPAFESWLERKLVALTPGIRADVEGWLRTLREGGPRS
ncbi:hypothetical protein ACIHFD_67770, partial [Nonomuraea sp. NPDC051941]|uniref:hypothetical protein n=1 Tax=Nonomuraea sp. NPDC051941 TaxID=3364373 RepID=UPI0037CCC17E